MPFPRQLANVKATGFFQDGPFGWSESLYRIDPTSTPESSIFFATQLFTARLNLCGSNPNLIAVRCSRDNVFRDSVIQAFSPPLRSVPFYSAGGKLGVGDPGEMPYSIALCRIEATSLYRGMHPLSGLPDYMFSDPNNFTPDNIFNPNFLTWQNFLNGSTPPGWGIKVRLQGADNPEVPITAVNYIGVGGFVQFTSPTLAATAGDRVRIRLVSQTPKTPGSINRSFTVTNVVGTVFTINMPAQPATVYNGGGVVSASMYGVKAITGARITFGSRRARGRPFGSPRGRRRPIRP